MILFWYIFRQVFLTAIAAVGLFVFILVTGNALREIVGLLAGGRLGVGVFGELLALLIPYVVAYALPLGLLSAILIVFGRLSAQREIIAMKAAGMSLYRVSAPVWVIGLMGTVLCLFVNLQYAPHARAVFRERVANVFVEDPLQFIQPGRFIEDFPGYILYAEGQLGSLLTGFNIWELNTEGQVTTVLKAEEGSFHYDPGQDELILTLKRGSGERRNRPDLTTLDQSEAIPSLIFQEARLKLPLSGLLKKTVVVKKLSLLTVDELLEKRRQLRAQEIAGDVTALKKRIAVQMQLQKGIAMACSVLAFAAIAIPLGIRVSRLETYANLALALGLAMAYYLSMVLITWLEGVPLLRPDFLVWIPNVILMGLGLLLLQRMNKH